MSTMWASLHLPWFPLLAGLVFEMLLISILHIALAVGVLASTRHDRLRGIICGIALLALLAWALLSWKPLITLRDYARCVEPHNMACPSVDENP